MELTAPLRKFGQRIFHKPATPFHRFCVMYVVVMRHTGVQRPQLGLFVQFGYQRTRCSFSLVGAVLVLLGMVTYGLYASEG